MDIYLISGISTLQSENKIQSFSRLTVGNSKEEVVGKTTIDLQKIGHAIDIIEAHLITDECKAYLAQIADDKVLKTSKTSVIRVVFSRENYEDPDPHQQLNSYLNEVSWDIVSISQTKEDFVEPGNSSTWIRFAEFLIAYRH